MAKKKDKAPVTLKSLQKLIRHQQEQIAIYEARALYLEEQLLLKELS